MEDREGEVIRMLRARTVGEARLYLRTRKAVVLAERSLEREGRPWAEIDVLQDGVERCYAFALGQVDDGDELHLGGGCHSRLLDPVDLLLFASEVERHLPERPERCEIATLRAVVADLELAAEAVEEVTKFIPQGSDRVPRECVRSTPGGWLYEKEPERFSRGRLVDLAARLRRLVLDHRAALDGTGA